MNNDAKFDWKTKWQNRDSDGDLIEWIVETPDGYAARIHGCKAGFLFDRNGKSVGCLRLYLLPIPPKPEVAYWSKPEDVDPLIDRLKYRRDCDTTSRISLGAPVVCIGKGGLIVCSVLTTYDGSEPEPMADLIAWKKLTECEYRRIGEATWRPCSNTATSEANR